MITKKKYYQVDFTLKSPLTVGSGENDRTDSDIIKDSLGTPYIPATAIAGVVREKLGKDKAALFMGDVNTENGEAKDSYIIFYDGTIKDGEKPIISVRDSVALDENKTAKSGAKFDMEILEPGIHFRTYLEQSFDKDHNEDCGAEIAGLLQNDDIFFGARTMRGYGKIGDVRIKEASFDMEDVESVNNWLDFNLYDDTDLWNDFVPSRDVKNGRQIKMSLKQRGGISIRRYTTKVRKDEESQPDSEYLSLHDDDNTPVIPGTSWAGAIRHRMSEFGIDVDGPQSIFGYVNGEAGKARSRIRFGESQLYDGGAMTLSRNAIDRFTGGTVDGALFTERSYYNGKAELVISWSDSDHMPENEQKALAAALTDLHFGFLAVGGETSIGRGLFSIADINGESVPDATADNGDKIYEMILKNIREVF